jgi:hypothetical protein
MRHITRVFRALKDIFLQWFTGCSTRAGRARYGKIALMLQKSEGFRAKATLAFCQFFLAFFNSGIIFLGIWKFFATHSMAFAPFNIFCGSLIETPLAS